MCCPPIEWSFVRGKSQIALVTGHVYPVVVDEETFIQWSNGNKTGGRSSGWSFLEEFYCILHCKKRNDIT